MGCCTTNCQKWTTFSLAGLFLLVGVLMAVLWDMIFNKIVIHELSLANNKTKGYSNWQETPIPMYLEFYLFNWTNPDDVTNSAIKPNFEEHGPYTYHEHHIRENITFNDNGTISFQTKRLWKFLPEKSVGSLSDKITTVNPIVVTIGNIIKYKHYLVKRGVNFLINEKHVKLSITKTVDEFIFEGYDDPMLDLAHKLNISGFKVPYTKFGWFVERNGSASYDGMYNMYTGADDIKKLGILNTWNYDNTVSFFDGNCAKVEGTTGELWYPPKDRPTIKLFASDLCSEEDIVQSWLSKVIYVGGDTSDNQMFNLKFIEVGQVKNVLAGILPGKLFYGHESFVRRVDNCIDVDGYDFEHLLEVELFCVKSGAYLLKYIN